MEFAALSRLTNKPVYEKIAHRAMESIWQHRNKVSNLVGNVINVNTGRWVRQDAGVGAGIDSYYEYCLKSYILLGDVSYWDRFQKHYGGIMRYIKQGAALVDVYLGNPHQRAKHFMDALLAFWPGLQVLTGDVEHAVSTHHMLFHVMRQHKFIPEAFTVDFRVHWAQHPLRPEFIESTYFLYKATRDSHYRKVGEEIIDSLQKYARVPCGFAAVHDIRTLAHEDRLDSFVLAETFKYLYLLYTDDHELPFDINSFLFTTEAHLLPLSLSRFQYTPEDIVKGSFNDMVDQSCVKDTAGRICDNLGSAFGGMVQVAVGLRDALSKSLQRERITKAHCRSEKPQLKERLKPEETDLGNADHINILADMGVLVKEMKDGRMQFTHDATRAASKRHSEQGILFMQELVQRVKMQQQEGTQMPVYVEILFPAEYKRSFMAGPAIFGPSLLDDSTCVIGNIKVADPPEACGSLENGQTLRGHVALIRRGSCTFIEKVINVQSVGAAAAVIVDNRPAEPGQLPFAMSSDVPSEVSIPSVFCLQTDGDLLWSYVVENEVVRVRLSGDAKERDVRS
ncbi:ER degradation-enhancing alpha-mannosidase-like protein 3 isoform X2 [Corticium candelabrum]|uniref:ER degradation-enhancing alpha-mannosidase-like protein 3 isoform X2 n=1 Tax=Corticium candelabrum TaxID=121492 RepID=UPI002E26DEB8|nr:ER degradation-enhancing alpha-mannosidase-like protein 3 isoform X2 [Corticium candelabrum]